MSTAFTPNPKLDLVLQRTIDAPPELVWRALTESQHLKEWFAPKPWTVAHIELDLRPGGIFKVAMRSPEGQVVGGDDAGGCVLEVVPNVRLVWTDAMGPGFRPSAEPFFTAIMTLAPAGKGTRYTAIAVHRDPETRAKHEAMGFHEGWGTCATQLAELVRGL